MAETATFGREKMAPFGYW